MSTVTPTPIHAARTLAAVLAVLAVAAAAGFWMSLTSPEVPGTEALTLEDGVDAVGIMLFGVLGVVLWSLRSGSEDLRDLLRAMVVAAFLFVAFNKMIHLNYQFVLVPLACVVLAADAMGSSPSSRTTAARAGLDSL